MSLSERIVRRFIGAEIPLSPLEKKVLNYLVNEADDADLYANFSRAPTYEVADKLEMTNDAAYRVLASLARKKLVTKSGRVSLDKKPGGWKGPEGDKKQIGWQLWEVQWDDVQDTMPATRRRE